MDLDDIALELARSIFILSDKNQYRKEPWLFMFHIDDWIRVETNWMSISESERDKLINDAKMHLIMLKDNFPTVYELLVTRIIPSNHKSIEHLFDKPLI